MTASSMARVGQPSVGASGADARFEALDSWRGIAAVIVTVMHFHVAAYIMDVPIFQNGGLAVPLFFVLSGFVIAHTYQDRISVGADLRAFLIRRLGRIYPLYLLALVGLVGIELVKLFLYSRGVPAGDPPFTGVNSLPKLAASVFLLQAIIPFDDYSWNGPTWSISTEIFAYVVFALAMLFGGARRSTWSLVIFLTCFVILAAYEISGVQPSNPATQGVGLLVCVFGFFTGAQTLRVFHWLSERGWRGGLWVEVAGLSIATGLFWFDPFADLGTCLGFALVILAFAGEGGALSRLLTTAMPQFLGRISYSIYVIHLPVIAVVHGFIRALQSKLGVVLMTTEGYVVLEPKFSRDLLVILILAVVIAISAISYRYIEMPARDFFNAIANRKTGGGHGARQSNSA